MCSLTSLTDQDASACCACSSSNRITCKGGGGESTSRRASHRGAQLYRAAVCVWVRINNRQKLLQMGMKVRMHVTTKFVITVRLASVCVWVRTYK